MRLAPIGLAFGAETAPDAVDEEAFRRTTEDADPRARGERRPGRARPSAALVLRDDPRSLHVRLDGPRERRIEQAVRLGEGERAAVEKRLDETDRAREAYVRHFYRADPRDPAPLPPDDRLHRDPARSGRRADRTRRAQPDPLGVASAAIDTFAACVRLALVRCFASWSPSC